MMRCLKVDDDPYCDHACNNEAVAQCKGGSRIQDLGVCGGEGATTLEGVQQSVILQNFVENCMKMNDFFWGGGKRHVPGAPHGSTTAMRTQ